MLIVKPGTDIVYTEDGLNLRFNYGHEVNLKTSNL